jgi:hypothetical protein
MENGYYKSFNGELRDELLNGEIFLHVEGGSDRDRELAAPLQHGASTLVAEISTGGILDRPAPVTESVWKKIIGLCEHHRSGIFKPR